ncbi:glycoside hydrolase family 38 C-terminal domain-containing protein [uncultured Robinsoniella sp.]|uniref:glycoside hydrolase family 38 N-terminal domain-containing protein n=1 Tax=uncultured Robinsoniella sp. TaxID=904190 RepID=UPI00374F9302
MEKKINEKRIQESSKQESLKQEIPKQESPKQQPRKKIHMIGNTHIDPVWLWNRYEGMQEVKSSFMSALDRMDEFADFKFTHSSISYLEWMKENCPHQFQRIQRRVEEGRWNIAGGMWVEPDSNLPSGESLIRHFLYSKRFVKENFGVEVKTAYNVDSFGHGANLPAVLKGCGIEYYVTSRPDKEKLRTPPVFVWKAPDGSSVVAERTGGEYMAWTRPAIEINLSESLAAMKEHNVERMAVFYGVGNHGGGPTIENIRSVYELKEDWTDLDLDFSTIDEFFTQVDADKLNIFEGELGRIFQGCYSSDCELKQLNRKAEWALQEAESMYAMAVTFTGVRKEAEENLLEAAWKEVLFNQFHDVLAGTSIESARNESCEELKGAVAAARKIVRNAIQAMANQMDTRGEGFPLILFNPTGCRYRGTFCADLYVPRARKKQIRLRDWKGREIPYCETGYQVSAPESRKGILFEADVPAYGYALYRTVLEGPEQEPDRKCLKFQDNVMDNGILKVHINEKTGCPDSMLMGGMELLGKEVDIKVFYDDRGAWGETALKEELRGRFSAGKIRLIETTPMRLIVRSLLYYEKSEMAIDYIMEKGSDRLKLAVSLTNLERHCQICFCVPGLEELPKVKSETAFYVEQKISPDDSEYYQHRFADMENQDGSGIAILNDSTYGVRQAGREYRLILSRSVVFARGKGGPLEESFQYRYMNQGSYDFQMVLLPHTVPLSNQRLFQEADFLMMPVKYLGDSCHSGRSWTKRDGVLQVLSDSVSCSVLKTHGESGDDRIIRLFETAGTKSEAIVKAAGKEAVLQFQPFEIKTMKISADGFRECNMLEDEKTR